MTHCCGTATELSLQTPCICSSLPFGCMQWPQTLNKHLEEVDPELYDIIEHEKNRQWKVVC